MNNLSLKLFCSFFKIGAFTFGGGWAMILILEKEIVDKKGWMTREDFLDALAVVQALPGVIAVNMACMVGYKLRGLRGAVAAALGAILPSFLIILAIAIFLTPAVIKTNPTLAAIFKGIRPAVVALIIAPVLSSGKSAGITWKTVAIPASVAVLVASRLPFVSNPILYIVIAILAGWYFQSRQAKEAIKHISNNRN